jgi:cell wall-associated NlpC family hydrolase
MSITGTQLISEIESLASAAGYKYIYGGTTSAGYDCSGIIYAALQKLGYSNPPRTSEDQWAWVQQNNTTVSASQLETGDLVFAQFPGDNASPGHVGIYIGNGNVFSAEDPSAGIGVSTLASWAGNIVGYGRVPSETTTGTAAVNAPTTASSGIGGVFSWAPEITGFFKDADTFTTALGWIVKPGSWLRIGAFFLAMLLLIGAIIIFTKTDQKIGSLPKPIPVPV